MKETFGAGGGSGIAVRDGWLYYSTNSAVYRYRLTPGRAVPKGEPETDRLRPARGEAARRQVLRLRRPGPPPGRGGVARERVRRARPGQGAKGKDPTEFLKTHGGFWRFDANKGNQTQADGFHFSTGHRHMVALAWNPVSKAFFVVMHGRDKLSTVDPDHYSDDDNAELPAEEMHLLKEGGTSAGPSRTTTR